MSLLDKVKDVAGKAADQAKHATEVGKEKLEDHKLGKQVQTLFQEIGELVVQQRRGTAPADAATRIDVKISEITELESQIEANSVADAAEGTTESAAETPPES
jgi:hypothetical protein